MYFVNLSLRELYCLYFVFSLFVQSSLKFCSLFSSLSFYDSLFFGIEEQYQYTILRFQSIKMLHCHILPLEC